MAARELRPCPTPTEAGLGDPEPRVAGIRMNWLFQSATVRIARWRCQTETDGWTPERRQYWRVIGFVHGGAYQIESSRGRTLIDPTRVALFNPLEPYRTSHPCGLRDRGSSVIVRADVLEEILAERMPGVFDEARRRFVEMTVPCTSRAYLLERALLRAVLRDGPRDPMEIEERGLRVAEAAFESLPVRPHSPRSGGRQRRRAELAETARELLAKRLDRPRSLGEVARSLGCSPFHLCRVFRAHTGLSVHRYITQLRLRSSLERLAAGERDLTDLSLDLGFSSHSHFTAAFRREFGRTPSAFRAGAGQSPSYFE
jgi:AraC family transcriptional regulator